jgi:hypothetical protein
MTVETTQAVSARDKLRSAIDKVQTCKDAVRIAKEVADRGIADLNRATNALRPFESLDARLARARIDALKVGRWEGYSDELRTAQKEKIHALEEAKHAKAASDQLDAELDDARDALMIAERAVDEAAADVFTEVVGDVVAQLERLNREREYLRRVLRGAALPFGAPGLFERLQVGQRRSLTVNAVRGAELPAGTLEGWLQLHGSVLRALSPPRLPDSEEADLAARAYWQGFAKELASDPDAQPGPLPDRDSILI